MLAPIVGGPKTKGLALRFASESTKPGQLQFERMRITRAYPAGRLAFLTFEFGLPPKVNLADSRRMRKQK